jgi:hypothetical protein
VKNVLRCQTTSEALLAGKPPSLLAAIEASVLFPALGDSHKDTPFVPEFDYNHFVQLSVVVTVRPAGADHPFVVGYCRTPGMMPFSYVHTQGLAILWTTGFLHGLGHTADLDMHEWVLLAQQSPKQAAEAFMGTDDPVLLRLLGHRLDLSGHKWTISPLGVVANDQRSPTVRRVYSQYVFRVDVNLPDAPREIGPTLRELVIGPEQPVQLDWHDDRDERFVNGKGQPNLMDIVTWRALRGEAEHVAEGSAVFARPFAWT